ncbi:MAG TPA: acyl-CoA synthetase [Solirubrobacteraceae bacterium]|nr:acyl-CoA synthetase [Solirubrobacteraceae bacterium]
MSSRNPLDVDLRRLLGTGAKLAGRAADEAYFARVCFRAGVFEIESPQRLARIVHSIERHGLLASSIAIGAIRQPDRVAIRDERGDVTFRELHGRINALANAWRARGVRAGDGITILVRNHRGFLEALFAGVLCGARVILLNTSFAGPQIRDVAEREGTDLLVYDDEFGEMLAGVQPRYGRFRAWVDDDATDPAESLDALIAGASTDSPPKAERHAKLVILTSGTTGAPKGAPRDEPRSLAIVGGLLSRVPLRARECTVLATPMFHTLGLAGMALGLALGSTLVIHRRFDPEVTLDALADNRATALIVVPVMLQRIVDLGLDAISSTDLRALRVIVASGSALGPALVTRATGVFGPVVYNLYGSTEIAQATIATPDDLALDPGTVGRPVRGTVVKIFGEDGRELPAGESGRIFVGNYAQFEGYSGGGSKDQLEGLMSSGDVGHFDERGLLFIDGRDDEMIVSGGENVFPAEVEELLAGHEAIVEAAAIGVADERFGQRLKAFVVLHGGRRLSADEVRQYVRDNLATYKVPRDVVFVDELPRNPTGKVLKRELAARD